MAEPAAAGLTLRLFSAFEAHLGETPLPRLRTRKGHWLLALLALRPGVEVERAWLAGTLWPESAEASALANLRSVLKDLRHALGVEADRLCGPTTRTLCLDLAGAEVDVREFDAAVARGDAASLQQAVAYYRGPLLEECGEEWVFQERQVREQAYLGALEGLAAEALRAADHAVAERWLRRAVAVDPLRESAQRALMQVLGAGGCYGAALLVYRELRERLHREINVAPDAETTALYEQLRAEARHRAQVCPPERASSTVLRRRPSEASRHNLPLQLTSFIGREREIAEVKRLLAQRRLVTLTGTGGCGKTRLAQQIATEMIGEFSDGAWSVELASLADEALVPQTLVSALGLQEEPGRSPNQALIEYLAPRQLLLVLDNCEHLIGACATLADSLLRSCLGLRILASSREPLAIAGETTYRVPSLSLPDPCQLPAPGEGRSPDLTQYEAIQLFIDRATSILPAFAVTGQNAQAVAQLCYRLDGIPLAIELAAARVRMLTVEEVVARLNDRFRVLTGGSRTALRRHQTLRALIDWSYDLLSEPERVLLSRLSVFAGGWTMEAAEAVCSDIETAILGNGLGSTKAGEIQDADALDLLSSLVDKSLVVVEEGGGQTRYRFLETIRQYAQDRLLESGEFEVMRSRQLEYFAELAEWAQEEYWGPNLVPWLDRLEVELDNLRAALEWGGGQPKPPEAWARLIGALEEFWHMRDHGLEGLGWVERARASVGIPPPVRARLLTAMQFCQTDREAAEESVQIYRALRDRLGLSYSLFIRALARDNKERCRAWSEEALAISREIGSDYLAAWSLLNLGTTEIWAPGEGSLSRGVAALEESVQVARRTGNPWVLGWTTRDLGHALFEFGDRERARSLLLESHRCFQAVGCRFATFWTLKPLGAALLAAGYAVAARVAYEENLALQRKVGDRHDLADALLDAGRAARNQRDLPAARAYFEEASQLSEELADQARLVAAIHNLGEIARLARTHEEASQFLEQSLALARANEDRAGILASLHKLAQLALDQQDWARARNHWADLIALAQEWIALEERPGAQEGWSRYAPETVSIARGRPFELWNRASNWQPLLGAVEGLGRMWQQRGRPARATRLMGAVQAARDALRPSLWGYQPPDYAPAEDIFPSLKGSLGGEAFTAAWAEGRAMSLEQAIACALAEASDG